VGYSAALWSRVIGMQDFFLSPLLYPSALKTGTLITDFGTRDLEYRNSWTNLGLESGFRWG
jgi:hypothetical protein